MKYISFCASVFSTNLPAGVCPHVREGDLGRRPLRQQQLVAAVEQEHREGSVANAAGAGRRELMRLSFANRQPAQRVVILVHGDDVI